MTSLAGGLTGVSAPARCWRWHRLRPGQVIANRYELRRRIGVGGVAEVFLAIDRVLGRKVALKFLTGMYAAEPTVVERFRREAKAAAALNHPNIVAVYDWGPHEDSYFMVMEYVPGANLKEILATRG